MSEYYLAHLNVVRPIGPFNASHPNAVYFFSQLEAMFEAAKTFEGLYWHKHGARRPDGRLADMMEFVQADTSGTEENVHVLTMAGWSDVAALHRFAYRLDLHREGVRTLRDWVDRSQGATMVMWWVPSGQKVSLEDGWERLEKLRRDGPSQAAFSLQKRYAAPDAVDHRARA